MLPSSRTPEGSSGHCPVCDSAICIEPSRPAGDATCPVCGSRVWFDAVRRAEARSTDLPQPITQFNFEEMPRSGGGRYPWTFHGAQIAISTTFIALLDQSFPLALIWGASSTFLLMVIAWRFLDLVNAPVLERFQWWGSWGVASLGMAMFGWPTAGAFGAFMSLHPDIHLTAFDSAVAFTLGFILVSPLMGLIVLLAALLMMRILTKRWVTPPRY